MKTKIYILFMFFYVSGVSYSQAPEAIWQILQNGDILRWVYTFGDEFNEETFDDNKWLNSYPYGRNYEGTCYQEYMTNGQNIEFDNGRLKLIAKEESLYDLGIPYESADFPLIDGGPNLRNWNYTSGMIYSKRRFKYGLYEIKFKVPVGKGLWPAFWLHGGNPNEEIDIFEYKGETPNKLHIDVHHPNENNENFGDWVTNSENFSDEEYTIWVDWSPNFIIWSLNGYDFAIWLGSLNFQANLIANLGIANNSPCAFNPGPDENTSFPATFEIDHIRVYNRVDCDQIINITNYNQSITEPTAITGKKITMNSMVLQPDALQPLKYLSLIATEEINLEVNSYIEGDFEGKIVECPGPGQRVLFNDTTLLLDNMKLQNKEFQNLNDLKTFNKTQLKTKIYPNPTSGLINIEFDGEYFYDINIELINSVGQTVYKKNYVKDKILSIDISKLDKGVYTLIGTFNNNKISEKIILN